MVIKMFITIAQLNPVHIAVISVATMRQLIALSSVRLCDSVIDSPKKAPTRGCINC